ncbi:uncharacterized protein MEPE_06806 [Melanopsichium pennsylvanicum]|uniref:Uncharacterized protein n=2 Tax=Melanopsichium pennsylvanicum TaxID=63383 RepID=A0AAJ5C8K0_9BASI|nr:putative protein [Melanopsichium pennsylvanicum 4]SNX88095.1 uncharacterized protein MEPE_06806 [Melanopsichium pennsylvanicum]
MSAPIRKLQRGSIRAFSQSSASLVSRSGSASSSANPIASSSSSSARSKSHNKVQRRKRDEILRKAVEMYHLTPAFLPTPQRASSTSATGKSTASSAAAWESALDNTIYSSILNTDSVSRRSPNLVPRGLAEFSREQSLRAASVPAFGNTEESASSRANSMNTFASDLTSTTFLTRREREAAAASDSVSAGLPQSSKASASSKENVGGLEHFTDADIAMYHRRHNHAAGAGSSGIDGSRYSGAERLTHLDRAIPGGNEWYRSQGLDSRSARVRDAIFGTINGELPGLEVVRERIARMRREHASESTSGN